MAAYSLTTMEAEKQVGRESHHASFHRVVQVTFSKQGAFYEQSFWKTDGKRSHGRFNHLSLRFNATDNAFSLNHGFTRQEKTIFPVICFVAKFFKWIKEKMTKYPLKNLRSEAVALRLGF